MVDGWYMVNRGMVMAATTLAILQSRLYVFCKVLWSLLTLCIEEIENKVVITVVH